MRGANGLGITTPPSVHVVEAISLAVQAGVFPLCAIVAGVAVSAGRASGLPTVLPGISAVFPVVGISVLHMWLPAEVSEMALTSTVIVLLAIGFAFAPGMGTSTFSACNHLHVDFVLMYR